MQYAAQMSQAGQRSLMFSFDEIRGIVLARADALGINFTKQVHSGLISVEQVDPAEISPGEFGARVLRGVADGCKLIIIDSLNGYMNAMPGEKYLNNQLHELSAFLNQQGVVTIFIVAQHGFLGTAEAPIDLSYLADTVINLRFFEAAGAVKQAVSVMKKRSGHHERMIREFQLRTGQGLRIGRPLAQFRGILTGMPRFEGTADQTLEQPADDTTA
jgi:circadian clock protein KaiC